MTFAPVSSIEVTLTKEDYETLEKAYKLITDLTIKMRDTSLYIAECQLYEDSYNIEFDELNRVKFVLQTLENITNIY